MTTAIIAFSIGILIPDALAVAVDTIGSNDPSIAAMWTQIGRVLPFFDVGREAVGMDPNKSFFIKAIRFMMELIGGTAVAVLIYAGIKMIMSQGNEEGTTEAKKIATYAIAGLILAILTDTIVNYLAGVVVRST
ncbi:MAG: hypothetical protein Q7R81_00785 [Candidatus Peregrinibacteria bacterium]|nr:hypothetical protein [Candidatus Peregrinibacteria bacterium]